MSIATFLQQLCRLLGLVIFPLILASGAGNAVLGNTVSSSKGNKSVKHDLDVTITPSGDAIFRETLSLPTPSYLKLKSTASPIKLIRTVQQSLSYAEIHDLQASYDDSSCAVQASYVVRGYLRVNRPGEWTLKFPAELDLDLLSTADNTAILTHAVESEIGAMAQTLRLHLPPASSNVLYHKATNELTFEYEPAVDPAASEPEVEFRLDSKPHLMSCLASLYGDEKFTNFWASRTVFKNSGSQALKNYRIRSRVAGHSGWSPWSRSKVVYPGQTVVDPFFPVFDLDSLSEMSTARPAMIEVEYEYETADGRKVSETDAARIQLLARNQVVYSSHETGEVLDWAESFEYSPFIIAAFAHADDPAIQQLAGRVSGLANGVAASRSDAEAEAFLTAMWHFMQANKISYQTPPGLSVNNTFGQNIKYGRDVLRNRAGTCIDLAILWASTAKAVGLKSYVMIVPEHAFPVIGLPSGQLAPLESTLIGSSSFAQASEAGVKAYQAGLEGSHFLVDIDELQNAGVRSLDLTPVSDDFLAKLGYAFDLTAAQGQVNRLPEQEAQPNLEGNPTRDPDATRKETNYRETSTVSAMALLGTWGHQFEEDGQVQQLQFTFQGNSNYLFESFNSQNGEWIKTSEGNGSWGLQGSTLVMRNAHSGQEFSYPARFVNGQLHLRIQGEELVMTKLN